MFDLLHTRPKPSGHRPVKVELADFPRRESLAALRHHHQTRVSEGVAQLDCPATRQLEAELALA